MKRLLILIFFSFPLITSAQSLELGLMLGASGYQGDLSPSTNITSTSGLHPSIGFFGRINRNRLWSYRLSFSYGVVSANDADAQDESRRRRNLNFRSKILELALTGELNFLGRDRRLSPYLFGGIALFNFNPQAEYQGRRVDLQPLGTEGQGLDNFPDRYNRVQFSIPFGIGLKFAINDRLNLGVEIGLRKTFTDYLDDVSGTYVNYNELLAANGQLSADLSNRTGEFLGTDPLQLETGTRRRGNPDSKDWYFINGVTLSYSLFDDKNSWGGKHGKKQLGCPFQ
ncbi:MAG: DUF6089 family protein [Bacteroidota bacterium]